MKNQKINVVFEESIYKANLAFTKIQSKYVSIFTKGTITDPKASLKRISQKYGEKNHTNLTRFFTKDWWDDEKINEQRIIELINKEETIELISDDTNNKKFGKVMEGVDVFKRHEGDGFEKAHCYVITGYYKNEGCFYPLFTSIYLKKEEAKKLGIPFKTKHEIHLEHIEKIKKLGIKCHVYLFDSWYFNEKLLDILPPGTNIVSQLKSNYVADIDGMKAKISVHKRKIDRRKLKVFYSEGKRVRYKETIATLNSGRKVKLVFFISSGNTMKVLISTNLNWSAKRIFYMYSHRQSIEVYIRDCKQELHMNDAHFKRLDAHAKWHVLIMLIYTRIRQFIWSKKQKNVTTVGEAIDYFRKLPEFHLT